MRYIKKLFLSSLFIFSGTTLAGMEQLQIKKQTFETNIIETTQTGQLPEKVYFIFFDKIREGSKKITFNTFKTQAFAQSITNYVAGSLEKKEPTPILRPKPKVPTKKLDGIEEVSQKEPWEKKISVEVQHVLYPIQKKAKFFEWVAPSANALIKYLKTLQRKQNEKIILCTLSGSMKVVARATKQLPYHFFHSLVAIDAYIDEPYNLDAIEHRLYNFYFEGSQPLFTTLVGKRGKLPTAFDKVNKCAKVINLHCLCKEKDALPDAKIGVALEQADRYCVHTDLAVILCGDPVLVFIHSALTKEESDALTKYFRDKRQLEQKIEIDKNISAEVMQDMQEVVTQPEKGFFASLFSTTKKYLKKLGQATGLLYTPYEVKKEVIGPFFVPHDGQVYLVLLVKNEAVRAVKTKPKLLFTALPFKRKYTVLKANVTKHLGEKYEILPSKITGTIPKLPQQDEDFQFFVYGDVRKHDRTKHHDKPTIAYQTGELLEKQKGEIFQLLTGDLIIDGSSVDGWAEFLDRVLHPAAKDKLITSAIGNHDISSRMQTLKNGVYLWFFNNAIPHFGNFFYFKRPFKGKIPVATHIASTQSYFKIGSVGFVHLPLPTEETKYHYLENPIAGMKEIPRPAYLPKAQMSCYNYTGKIFTEFANNLEKATRDKKNGIIKFIIVYGHAPLITNYSHKMPHKGLFNTILEQRATKSIPKISQKVQWAKFKFTGNIERFFIEYPIDAYLCGHNHIYDRGTWKINEKISIPMVTMGVGTDLKKLKETKITEKKRTALEKKITQHQLIYAGTGKKFIGYIDCQVEPKSKQIVCKLIGEKLYNNEISKTQPMVDQKRRIYDEFTIRSR